MGLLGFRGCWGTSRGCRVDELALVGLRTLSFFGQESYGPWARTI